jgi:hypothetical protein
MQLHEDSLGEYLYQIPHCTCSQRGLDIQKPNSQNRDPIFTNYSLPEHTPGYPVFVFGDLGCLCPAACVGR